MLEMLFASSNNLPWQKFTSAVPAAENLRVQPDPTGDRPGWLVARVLEVFGYKQTEDNAWDMMDTCDMSFCVPEDSSHSRGH